MTETFVSLNFDDEKKRLTMLTNLCRMLVRRGNLSFEMIRFNNDGSFVALGKAFG